MNQYTPLAKISEIRETARRAFYAGRAKSVAFRKEQIAQIGYLVKDNEDRLKAALQLDLGRPPLESELMDFGPTYKDVRLAYDNVEKWTRPQGIDFNLSYFAMGPKMKAEPKGVILIISAFNLPVFLTLGPLASAVAAGCAAVIKPSEANPHFNRLLAELLPQYLDSELYHVVQGGVPEMTKILELRWDHSGDRVGRIVAMAAAKHLTPVTLELGGKNPVVVDPKADATLTAKRVLWGRFSNAGQVCTAPEYVLVPRDFKETLVSALKETYHSFYPDGAEKSDSFARIVTEEHTSRIKRLLDRTKGDIVCGGQVDITKRYVAPTIVNNVNPDDSLMSEEIFGPVLLVIPVKDVDEAIAFIRSREQPLCVYVFSSDKKFQEKVFSNTESGAALANDVLFSPAVPGFPTGGVGGSGYGYYGGKHAFEQFTHWRVSLDNPSWIDTLVFSFRFPPYKDTYKQYLGFLYPSLPPRPMDKPGPRAIKKTWALGLVFVVLGASLLTKGLCL
ncbi:NAD-dependent aldehyde dehydrogenase [Earliella scabrosa]|nr:NAD-dependent aldehyde dehydrogenase [Earliella scabrosa]